MRLSFITSVLDGEPFVGDMLASVPAHEAIEHIAVDAGSTDGTLERLRAVPSLKLVERPGASLYRAWNEAIELAGGDALMFLNADDRLAAGGVEAVLDAFAADRRAEIVHGQAEAFATDPGGADDERLVRRYPEPQAAFDPRDLAFGAPAVNARIFRRGVFERWGRFDERFQIAADREFLLRLALSASPPRCAPIMALVYRYRVHPGSMTLSFSWNRRAAIAGEHRRIADRFLASGTASPDASAVLTAWRAREALAEAASQAARGRPGAALGPLGTLVVGFPGTFIDLWRARRLRRRWLDRLRNGR